MSQYRYNLIFVVLLIANCILLLFVADGLSISYKEAVIYFNEANWLLSTLTHISTSIFGQNNMALRLPFVAFYLGSVTIAYLLTNNYFKTASDRFASILIFMLLPGLNSVALLLNEAILVVFFTLLYLYLFKLTNKEHYWLLIICLFIDNSFAFLYLALFFYSLQKKDNVLLTVSLILFGASMQIYGFDTGGHPQGYFLDTFGAYASVFSPVVFLAFFYAIYRATIKKERDLYWYISFTAFLFSFIFSLRQKIDIADFAPFVIIAIPLMVKSFMHSYRVRLPQFRKKHYLFASFVAITLVINFVIFVINKPLYLVLNDNEKHFAYDYHIAKELAQELKAKGIAKILCQDNHLQTRLKFYGIFLGDKLYLSATKTPRKITVKYFGKDIKSFYIQDIR